MALSHSGLFALAPHQRPNILFWVGVRQRLLRRGSGHLSDSPQDVAPPSAQMLLILTLRNHGILAEDAA